MTQQQSDDLPEIEGVGLGEAHQRYLDHLGDGHTLHTYVTALTFAQPDGSTGFTIVANTPDREHVLTLLDKAGEVIAESG